MSFLSQVNSKSTKGEKGKKAKGKKLAMSTDSLEENTAAVIAEVSGSDEVTQKLLEEADRQMIATAAESGADAILNTATSNTTDEKITQSVKDSSDPSNCVDTGVGVEDGMAGCSESDQSNETPSNVSFLSRGVDSIKSGCQVISEGAKRAGKKTRKLVKSTLSLGNTAAAKAEECDNDEVVETPGSVLGDDHTEDVDLDVSEDIHEGNKTIIAGTSTVTAIDAKTEKTLVDGSLDAAEAESVKSGCQVISDDTKETEEKAKKKAKKFSTFGLGHTTDAIAKLFGKDEAAQKLCKDSSDPSNFDNIDRDLEDKMTGCSVSNQNNQTENDPSDPDNSDSDPEDETTDNTVSEQINDEIANDSSDPSNTMSLLSRGVHSVKSGCQVISDGTKQAGKKAIKLSKKSLDHTSAAIAKVRDSEDARKLFEEANRKLNGLPDSLPVISHVKGVALYASGDIKGGNRAMLEATRTATVMAARTGGLILGGVVGADAAQYGVDAVFDALVSITTNDKSTKSTISKIQVTHRTTSTPTLVLRME